VNFDRVAPFYRSVETIAFGNALQRARIRWLRAIPSPGRALIVGEGNGRFVSELLKLHPGVEIDCVDASAAMLKLAGACLAQDSVTPPAVRFLQRDVREWTTTERYDLIVTHFVLDCFEAVEVKMVVEKLARVATADATWLLADFTAPQSTFARMHAKAWLRAMYFFFRLTAGLRTIELVDPTADLTAQDFTCRARELSRFGMLKSELWSRQ
jgi:ubiquinone/menaquinone biosynthesis C-methylase UbiE